MPFSAAEATKRRAKSASTGREPTRKRPRSASPSGVLTRALSARIRSHGLSTPRLTAESKHPPPETSRYANPARVEDLREPQLLRGGNPPRERLLPEQADGRVGERRHARSLPRDAGLPPVRSARASQRLLPRLRRCSRGASMSRCGPDRGRCGRRLPNRIPPGAPRARRPGARSRGRTPRSALALAPLPEHLGERLLTDDRACEERAPERRHVRGGRVDAAVAATADGQMEDVRSPRSVDLNVPDRSATGKLVRAEEGSVAHARRRADDVADEVVERRTRCPLRNQGEHDEAAVAVGEALAGRELLRVPVEDVEICLGRGELLRRDGQQVLRQVQIQRPRRGSRRSPTGARAGARP